MKDLADKLVLVTGGANGIGRAIALTFIQSGSKIVVIDNDSSALKTLASLKPPPKYHEVDISQKESVQEFFTTRITQDIDVLINCAGVEYAYGVEDKNDDNWSRVMQVNLEGTHAVTRSAIKKMKRGSSIIFITSVHTAVAFEENAAYDASKHALVGLMRALALDLGPKGIRVNAVAPGAIHPTGISGNLTREQISARSKRIPLQMLGTPREVAEVCLFLASKKASYIHGAEIRVDGGLSIQNALFTQS